MKIAEAAIADEPRASKKASIRGLRQLAAPTPGYCHACGTWDLHMSICSCCGVDFDAPTPSVHEL